LQRWFGGGFFIAGDVPSGYAAYRPRFIVPEDVEERCAADSVTEALNRNEEPHTPALYQREREQGTAKE
jgi:hypothetical protein